MLQRFSSLGSGSSAASFSSVEHFSPSQRALRDGGVTSVGRPAGGLREKPRLRGPGGRSYPCPAETQLPARTAPLTAPEKFTALTLHPGAGGLPRVASQCDWWSGAWAQSPGPALPFTHSATWESYGQPLCLSFPIGEMGIVK